jgi:hypothetical protein
VTPAITTEARFLPTHALSDAQGISFAWSVKTVNLWEGSIRAGKTFVSFMAWCGFLIEWDGNGQHVIVGRTRDTVFRNVFQPIESEPSMAWLRPFVSYSQGAATARIFGVTVSILGANDASSAASIQGMTVASAYGDEVALWPETFFRQMRGRMSPPGARFYGTTNPDNPNHWLKGEIDAWKRGLRPDWRVFHQTMDDNPALDEPYKAGLRREYSGLWFRRFILGLWVSAEGAIYDLWDPDRFVVPHAELPPLDRYLGVGMDFGTTNATSAILLAVTAERDAAGRPAPRLAAVDEYRWDPKEHGGTRLAPVAQSERFRAWLERDHSLLDLERESQGRPKEPIPYVYLDPAAADFSEQLRADRLSSRPADNTVDRGIADVANLLTTNRFVVSKRCYGLEKEFPAYAWDPKQTEKGLDVPLKSADHSLDALRYVVRSSKQRWAPEFRNAYGRTAVLAA